jgi:tryptophanyl-tRNA synthetase
MSQHKERVLSGVQPSGQLHLGNYFGAIRQHITLQHEHPGEAFYFIADYHSLTSIHDSELLKKYTTEVAVDYLALGLDPNKSTFYRQSDVPQVCELMWILSCVTGIGLLERAHSYKEKVQQGQKPSVGLFMYPELMTADILLVRATSVPVGQDQVQHLEMARDIAGSFNATFNSTVFPLPATKLDEASIVPGIDGRKMSKSYGNTIPIFAEEPELETKVSRVKTSPIPLGSPLDPDTDTVFALYQLVSTQDQTEDLRQRYSSGAIGYQQAKAELLKNLREFFEPFKDKRRELVRNLDIVEDVLQEGAKRARIEADQTLEIVRAGTGLGNLRHVTS